jgi:hypothetical protein
MRELTKLQQAVVTQLLIDPDMQVCAVVTGCGYGYVRKLAMRDYIKELLDTPAKKAVKEIAKKAAKDAANKAELDATFVLLAAKEAFDRCMQKIPVMENGKPTGEWKFDSAGACKAIDIMAKHRGIQAYVPELNPPPPPGENIWTVKVVHMTKADYEEGSNDRPPIEHQP